MVLSDFSFFLIVNAQVTVEHWFVCFGPEIIHTILRLALFQHLYQSDPCSLFPETLHPPLTNNNLLPREIP